MDYELYDDDRVILKIDKCINCNKYKFRSNFFYNCKMNKTCGDCFRYNFLLVLHYR